MASRLHRTSYLARIGGGAGIGALALVTGACSPGGESSSTDYGVDAPAEPAAAPATDSDAPPQPAPEAGGEAPADAASTDTGG